MQVRTPAPFSVIPRGHSCQKVSSRGVRRLSGTTLKQCHRDPDSGREKRSPNVVNALFTFWGLLRSVLFVHYARNDTGIIMSLSFRGGVYTTTRESPAVEIDLI